MRRLFGAAAGRAAHGLSGGFKGMIPRPRAHVEETRPAVFVIGHPAPGEITGGDVFYDRPKHRSHRLADRTLHLVGAELGGVGDGRVHAVNPALVNQIGDVFELMDRIDIGHLRADSGGDELFKAFPGERAHAAHQHGLLAEDERLNTQDRRQENIELVEEIVTEYTREHEKWELLEQFQEIGIPSAVTTEPREVVEFEHLREREFWQEVPLPNGTPATMPGFPFRPGGPDGRVEMERAPRLGEHSAEVYASLSYDAERLASAGAV